MRVFFLLGAKPDKIRATRSPATVTAIQNRFIVSGYVHRQCWPITYNSAYNLLPARPMGVTSWSRGHDNVLPVTLQLNEMNSDDYFLRQWTTR